MKFKQVLVVILIVSMVVVLFIALRPVTNPPMQNTNSTFFVGVTFSANTTAEAKQLVDKVKAYTNLFVVDSGPISKNETSLNEICNYATSQGLHIIVYFGNLSFPWQISWINSAKERWGNAFLGIYFFDEPAGSLLDTNYDYPNSTQPQTYDEMANLFLNSWQTMPGLHTIKSLQNTPVTFTSDYALYWFDYLAGYDVVLSEFGWNNSRTQQIDMVRGAANVQNKSWGVIVTWTYDNQTYLQHGTYLENGTQLYDDMMVAYNNGAKYVIIFNYPTIPGNNYGDLAADHFQALQKFWRTIKTNPQQTSFSAQNVLVLPRNYGWGMRNQNDSIWGLWKSDQNAPQIWNITQTLLSRYGTNFDIVYDDSHFPVENKYSKIYLWNSTA